MGHNVRAYVCGRLQDGKSQFSSAEVLLSVTGREKQAFHSGEIKLELKNQNIWIWILQISFRKYAGPLWLFLHLQKLESTLTTTSCPASQDSMPHSQHGVAAIFCSARAASGLLCSLLHCLPEASQMGSLRKQISSISCRICCRNTSATVTALHVGRKNL